MAAVINLIRTHETDRTTLAAFSDGMARLLDRE